MEKSPYFKGNCKYTRFVCFDHWLIRYDHISTKKLLLYYWKSIFYLELFILFISTFSFLLFLQQYHRGLRDIASMAVEIFCFILCSILLTQWIKIRLIFTTFVLMIQKGPDLNLASPQSTICSYAPVVSLQCTKMINVDDITNENRTKHNTKWHVFQMIHTEHYKLADLDKEKQMHYLN